MKLRGLLCALLFCSIGLQAQAQGCWPENYGGVMLQGFYWDSFSDTKWTKLEQQADELAQIFDLIWVPNSGNCGPDKGMGYMPIWWFDHNGTFGTEAELRSMIKTFKSKNVGIIEDVVINHKAGVESWCDFAVETWDGHTLNWSLDDICRNDEAAGNGFEPTGAADTGDNFDGTRDLDHTSENVQQNVKWYLDFLLNYLGYAGFRYDMVKGYSGYYTGMYNATAKPQFSVGEFWDNFDNTSAWINKTAEYDYGKGKSAAFDFPLKFIINDVFHNGTWDGLAYKGLVGVEDYRRWSVTFVDNHDTYREESGNRLYSNVLAANALILGLPGTPCIFLPHWKHYKPQLKKMILARKAAGITNQSETWDWENVNGGRVIETKGTNGQVLVICGYVVGNEHLDKHINDNYKLVVSGDAANPNFAFYMSKDLTIPEEFIETEVTDGMTIYVDTKPEETNAHLYTWKGSEPLTTAWPGDKVSSFKTKTVKDKTWYYRTYDAITLNAILNNGNNGDGNQTVDIKDLVGDQFFTYTGGGNYQNVTDQYIDYIYQDLPECAVRQEGTYAYFENTGDWDNVYAYAFYKNGEEFVGFTGDWPGEAMEKVGQSANGHDVYRWTATAGTGTPATIIFNNGNNGKQTEDLEFVNAAYYNVNGPVETITVSTKNARYAQLFHREFTAGERHTVCLPFSLNEEETESLTGKMYEMSGYMGGYLLFSSVNNVEAFKPYIFIADETGRPFYKFAKKGMEEGEAQTVTMGDFSFIGSDNNQTVMSNSMTTCYDYNNNAFAEIGEETGMEVLPYRAYFTKSASSSATLKGILFDFEGVATSINPLKEGYGQMSKVEGQKEGWYMLDGRKLQGNPNAKGVYIYNGRKAIVK